MRRPLRTMIAPALALAVLATLTAAAVAFFVLPGALPIQAADVGSGSAQRGAGLALVGNCAACHTAEGGAPYAGGRAFKTAFGTIYSANITPSGTGLGGWSYAAFQRAMTDGVSRDGRYLYPAFPFNHFQSLDVRDLRDLYAYVQSRAPVEAAPPRNRMIWPLGFRPLLLGWRLLFFRREPPVAARDGPQSRGRYLVEALAHCGACHTPRNALGAERTREAYKGGWSDGWYAPPFVSGASPAPHAWTEADLYAYLREGWSDRHAAAAGPMGEVTRALARAPDADVSAIAAYVAGIAPKDDRPVSERRVRDDAGVGAALFAGACAQCHGDDAPITQFGRPPLSSGTPPFESTPRDVMAITLRGLAPPAGRAGPVMPAYADVFDDSQIASLAAYVRSRFSDRPAWVGDLTREARDARKDTAP